MKRILLAISLLLAVTGVHGAVQYEFRQTFHSDVDTMPSNDMTGRAVIDGDRYRVEFLSGSAFPAGSYVISTNAARQQIWVDPSKKSYVEVNAATAIYAADRVSSLEDGIALAKETINSGAVAKKLAGQGRIRRSDVTVLAITGNGLKTQDAIALPAAPVIDAKLSAFEAIIGAVAGAVA